MAEIASDGRKGYTYYLPSDDAIRAWRSRNREVT